MDKEAKHAHQDIGHVVKKGHVQNDCSVASGERASVSHKAHQEHDFITQLKGEESRILVLQTHLLNKTLWKVNVPKSLVSFLHDLLCWFSGSSPMHIWTNTHTTGSLEALGQRMPPTQTECKSGSSLFLDYLVLAMGSPTVSEKLPSKVLAHRPFQGLDNTKYSQRLLPWLFKCPLGIYDYISLSMPFENWVVFVTLILYTLYTYIHIHYQTLESIKSFPSMSRSLNQCR